MSTTTEKNITIANIQIKNTGKIFLEHFISNYLGSIIYCPEDYPFGYKCVCGILNSEFNDIELGSFVKCCLGNEDDTVVYLYWTNKNNSYNISKEYGTIEYLHENYYFNRSLNTMRIEIDACASNIELNANITAY
jgi:hypothetical protein